MAVVKQTKTRASISTPKLQGLKDALNKAVKQELKQEPKQELKQNPLNQIL